MQVVENNNVGMNVTVLWKMKAKKRGNKCTPCKSDLLLINAF